MKLRDLSKDKPKFNSSATLVRYCKNCGKRLGLGWGNRVFCSDKCRLEKRRKEKNLQNLLQKQG